MAKIITVWGNPGSGKSMFCAILAKALTYANEKAIIISPDMTTPMLPVWAPDQIVGSSMSVGQVLASLDIGNELVAGKVIVPKKYPYIGLMGYTSGEHIRSYPTPERHNVEELVKVASRMVDYLILDCTSDLTDVLCKVALKRADVSVCILTPDNRGLTYLKGYRVLLENAGNELPKHYMFAGLARPYHPIGEIGRLIGGWDGILPFTKDVDRCATKKDMFAAATYCHKKYANCIDKILDACDRVDDPDEYALERTNIPQDFPLEIPENPPIYFTDRKGDADDELQ